MRWCIRSFIVLKIMPRPRRSNLGRHTRRTRYYRRIRNQMSQEEIEAHREAGRLRAQQYRNTPGVREALNKRSRLRQQTQQRSPAVTQRIQDRRRARRSATMAFKYESTADYGAYARANIGEMTNVCQHCNAVKFINETPGLCCASGKVKLEPLDLPAEPIQALYEGVDVKFTNDTPELCCANGQVKLEPLDLPAEPLQALYDGVDPRANEVLILEFHEDMKFESTDYQHD